MGSMSATSVAECESCLRLSDDLVAVHRVYLRPNPDLAAAEPIVSVQPEVEQWCVGCRTHYPHQEA
jgi:putative heme degradation protein